MTPEQSQALATASGALTRRIAELQKAIDDRETATALETKLDEARSLHQALSDVIGKSSDIDPRVRVACGKLGEMLDGLERVLRDDEARHGAASRD